MQINYKKMTKMIRSVKCSHHISSNLQLLLSFGICWWPMPSGRIRFLSRCLSVTLRRPRFRVNVANSFAITSVKRQCGNSLLHLCSQYHIRVGHSRQSQHKTSLCRHRLSGCCYCRGRRWRHGCGNFARGWFTAFNLLRSNGVLCRKSWNAGQSFAAGRCHIVVVLLEKRSRDSTSDVWRRRTTSQRQWLGEFRQWGRSDHQLGRRWYRSRNRRWCSNGLRYGDDGRCGWQHGRRWRQRLRYLRYRWWLRRWGRRLLFWRSSCWQRPRTNKQRFTLRDWLSFTCRVGSTAAKQQKHTARWKHGAEFHKNSPSACYDKNQ